jgi:hypothetical protein
MNMMAFSPKHNVLFVCFQNRVQMFRVIMGLRSLFPVQEMLNCGNVGLGFTAGGGQQDRRQDIQGGKLPNLR